MPWQKITSISSTGRVVNEDHAGVAGHLAWVLDGAGLGQRPRFKGFATDAAWLVNEVSAWLTANATVSCAMTDLLDALQRHLTSAFGEPDATDPAGGPTACLTLARLRGDQIELAWIADTVALVPRYGDRLDIISDDRVAPFEAKIFAAMRDMPRPAGGLPDIAHAQIRDNRMRINQSDGFAVVAPSRPWAHLARHAILNMPQDRPLVLMTDGMSRVFDTFRHLTSRQVYEVCVAGQGNSLLDTVRLLEQNDPDAIRYPRFKIHDDATLVVVRAQEE
jgi:hypothetical protein